MVRPGSLWATSVFVMEPVGFPGFGAEEGVEFLDALLLKEIFEDAALSGQELRIFVDLALFFSDVQP